MHFTNKGYHFSNSYYDFKWKAWHIYYFACIIHTTKGLVCNKQRRFILDILIYICIQCQISRLLKLFYNVFTWGSKKLWNHSILDDERLSFKDNEGGKKVKLNLLILLYCELHKWIKRTWKRGKKVSLVRIKNDHIIYNYLNNTYK